MPSPRVYWDAAAWIAYIQKEMPGPDSAFTESRYEMCRRVLGYAANEELEIVTSAFTLSEVCKKPTAQSSPAQNLAAFFDQRYILLLNVDKQVGLKAQSLQTAGVKGLKPADAIHVASALVWSIPILHTFDQRLLDLDNVLTANDGTQLRIVRPTEEDPNLDLFKGSA